MPHRSAAIALFLFATAAAARADVHPNTQSGFPVDQVFQVGEIDNVNLFNGALTLTIPIGQTYLVGGGFSYGLKLIYNSSPWRFETVTLDGIDYTQGIPTECSNAGLGWRVSLGRLDPPCQMPDVNGVQNLVYQDETGTDHIWYETLHVGDPEDAAVTGVQKILYTRDGSYLRMKVYTHGIREVESPDGTTRAFNAQGLPTEIRDRFGNSLAIGYGIDPATGQPYWQLTDSQGRTDMYNTNRRPVRSRTVFHDDADRFAEAASSNFDGLGHYRTTTVDGNFGTGDQRTTTVNFNPARGAYVVNAGANTGSGYNVFPGNQPWITETYTSQQVTEGAETATTLFCFDGSTGFLNRKRVLKSSGTAESANDVLEVYGHTGGNVTSEQFFGGDKQTLTANNTTCTMALPATVPYQLTHTWSGGTRATSQYAGMTFKSLDLTVDARTGLPATSRDTATLQTGFEDDALGRLTWSKPSAGTNDGWTEYEYSRALSASSLAKVIVRKRANGSKSAAVLAQSEILFDAFGRVWRERQLLPNGTYSTRENGAVYRYDGFNQMVRMTSGAQDWAYIYTADDERLWSYNLPANVSNWTVRDLSGQVLREYVNDKGTWSLGTDYIRRDGQLLAAETRSGRRHFHLDHLGTPRLITNSVGYKKAYHAYYPFGEEATAFNQDSERMKFTGHERDLASGAGAGDDLDYMHHRFCSPITGRFLGIDIAQGKRWQPQSWNRYTYALDNPIRYIDPNGEDVLDAVNGFANAVGSNFLLGAGGIESSKADFSAGQKLGDLASLVAGSLEAAEGGKRFLLGALCTSGTIGGCVDFWSATMGLNWWRLKSNCPRCGLRSKVQPLR